MLLNYFRPLALAAKIDCQKFKSLKRDKKLLRRSYSYEKRHISVIQGTLATVGLLHSKTQPMDGG